MDVEVLRRGPLREDAWTSPVRSPRTAGLLGIALGVSFGVCFLTGVVSHLVQQPPGWFTWPARPAGLYRFTQGLHVATGIASVPLLLAKLWTVLPKFYEFPPVRSVTHGLERVSLLPLVAGSLFLLFSGVGNIARWRPWAFSFTVGHWWAAWITIGALVVHIGAKAGTGFLQDDGADPDAEHAATHPGRSANGGLSRRGFLGAVGAASGLLTVTTAGQSVGGLNALAVLAPRRPDVGPQGLPVNKSAVGARVVEAATSRDYRLRVVGAVDRALTLTVDDLRAMPMRTADLPIACVEGWSATGTWTGVPVRDLLDLAGAPGGVEGFVTSLQEGSLYRTAPLNREQIRDADTLLALDLNGEPLHLDHGFPVRLIGPNRPGVQQTKWVTELTALRPGTKAGDAR